eukprot:12010994-Alexandrium_andersonii.AAC.1
MSASLVGSEMCIRDRPFSPFTAGQNAGFHPALRKLPPTPGVAISESLVSVSYTHLTLPTICSV